MMMIMIMIMIMIMMLLMMMMMMRPPDSDTEQQVYQRPTLGASRVLCTAPGGAPGINGASPNIADHVICLSSPLCYYRASRSPLAHVTDNGNDEHKSTYEYNAMHTYTPGSRQPEIERKIKIHRWINT